MNDQDNDGEFASVIWDTPEGARDGKGQDASSAIESSPRRHISAAQNPAGDGSSGYELNGDSSLSTGNAVPSSSASGRYWIKATVGDAVKMLEGTKDAFVSYTVKGEVR